MIPQDIIALKRDGEPIPAADLRAFVLDYSLGNVPDYQMAAFAMATCVNGMSFEETSALTQAMMDSGETLDFGDLSRIAVDKHSTGGVGDKISIPLAPIVAACGIAVPMMSGRGLGHTGGTLDKLESIPGFSTQIEPDKFNDQLDDIGVAMVGQTDRLVPADRRIYELRDATGTVPSVPLISSSIMSKKLAEDLDGLLLDVKVGSGAFMKTVAEATELATTMVGVGASHNTPVTAILTNMDQPLGRAVGNANEIVESVEVLRGGGPADVTELTRLLAVEMLVLSGVESRSGAESAVETAVTSGAAYDVFMKLVERQGGDPAAIENLNLLPTAPGEHVITAQTDGFVSRCDAYEIGLASVRLGAGRAKKDDDVDHGVGLTIDVNIGDAVVASQPLATITYRDERSLGSALSVLTDTFVISTEPVESLDLILGELK